MDTTETRESGFGTTSAEWALLQLAYDIALVVSSGSSPPEETLAKFRYLDERSNLAFPNWWKTRRSV
jgi:hypothetical protein